MSWLETPDGSNDSPAATTVSRRRADTGKSLFPPLPRFGLCHSRDMTSEARIPISSRVLIRDSIRIGCLSVD
jgi:hypothetical protein